jgi:hypothetical protein
MPLKDLFAIIFFLCLSYFDLYFLIFVIVTYTRGAFPMLNKHVSFCKNNKFFFQKVYLNIFIAYDQVFQIKIILA